jgi:3-methylcrotonyl-CoA carboxylase alpha subunit
VFSKILIANRGEIACRIIRTARRLGVASVAVFSDADATAMHVRMADEAVNIGPAPVRDSYLRADTIIAAAIRAGAQAIHPGYGLLSEIAAFAEACANAGLVFIGPPAAAIRAMGSKSAAKALLQLAGVPILPGYHGEDQSPLLLQRKADELGYPLMIKASAGGGGLGMRRVDQAADFAAALASCQREASANFGEARVLIEKFVLKPRHIEIQVFTDTQGNGVYLFERDCSVQRRHQKVLEEAPAPGMGPRQRVQMGTAALAAAQAVGYVGAGTVEFIAEPSGAFFFMEMNTRLQVEHPVTEMITGLDLVEWQLLVAQGEALPLRQDQLTLHGHAIEARIYAEDPERDFLPSTGHLAHLRTPAPSSTIRLDAGVEAGDDITPYYDPLIAKLICWGETREGARLRLHQALGQVQIVGVANNIAFLSRLISTRSFANADLDTALIEREHASLFPPPSAAPNRVLIAAALQVLRAQSLGADRSGGARVWRCAQGWRVNAPCEQTLRFRDRAEEQTVIARSVPHGYELEVGAATMRAAAVFSSDIDLRVTVDGLLFEASVVLRGKRCDVFLNSNHFIIELVDPLAHVGEPAETEGHLRALMPGRVVALLVKAGARVERGEPLLILEAMKMEHTMSAPANGVCEAFNVEIGEQVTEGRELVRFRADVAAAPAAG